MARFTDRRDNFRIRAGIVAGAFAWRTVTNASAIETTELIFEETCLVHKGKPRLGTQMTGDAPGMWKWRNEREGGQK